ncbi:MAG: hypothetical protein AB1469_09925 [Pseudomonadota bacterium]
MGGLPDEGAEALQADAEYKADLVASVKGAGAGSMVGGLSGLVVGLVMLAIPGVGPVLAAGPLAVALAGAGVGVVAGGLIGAMTRWGIPENEAQYYAEGVQRGGTLLSISASDDMAEVAEDIIRDHGPVDIQKRAAEWRAGVAVGDDRPNDMLSESTDNLSKVKRVEPISERRGAPR